MKCAIVGAGYMGNLYADSIPFIPDLSIRWIVDKHEKKGKKLARKCHAKWSPTINPILTDSETAIVLHALPTSFRMKFLERYKRASKHILCEKPLARSIKEAKQIRDIFRAYDKVFMVGNVVRFFWDYSRARQMILSGEIGKPGIARFSRCFSSPDWMNQKDNWYLDRKKSGGVLLDLAIHDLDWLLWTFGPVKSGYARNIAGSKGISDYALAILRFKNGALAHIEASWIEAPGSWYTSFEVCGQEGMIEHDTRESQTLRFTPKKTPAREIRERPSMESPYVTELKHFVDCINSGKKPVCSVKEGYEAVRLALDLLESARTGKPVSY